MLCHNLRASKRISLDAQNRKIFENASSKASLKAASPPRLVNSWANLLSNLQVGGTKVLDFAAFKESDLRKEDSPNAVLRFKGVNTACFGVL